MKKLTSLSMKTKKRMKTIKAPCAGSGHFVTRIPLRLALPMVGTNISATIGSTKAKPVYKSRSDRPTRSGPKRQPQLRTTVFKWSSRIC